MKIDDVTNAADGLDPQNRAATVKLIDLKVEDDMKEVLNAMHNEFALLKTELTHIDDKFESKFGYMDSKISTGYTFFGIAFGVLAVLLAVLGVMIALK
ncbi:MAG: hypothetical protein E6Q66_04610 [Pedobacter sp.]|nr:MAG: hypothetical protein E6Q66_04610 [Pedobacter sp.]